MNLAGYLLVLAGYHLSGRVSGSGKKIYKVGLIMDQSPGIVILDRCTACVTAKKSSHYCRLKLGHSAARAMPCIVCSNEQLSMNECRVRRGHKEPNTSKTLRIQDMKSHQLPQCCMQLTCLSVSTSEEEEAHYITGFMRHYSKDKRVSWLHSYTLQTSGKFVASRGVDNREGTTKSGIVMIDGKKMRYEVKSYELLECHRGRQPRLKKETSDPLSRRNAPGSRKCGCTARLKCRVLQTEHEALLEVTFPLPQAHTGHTCTSIGDMLCFKPLSEVEEKATSLISDVHINRLTLKLVLGDWIQSDLIPRHLREGTISEPPHEFNRSYYPTKRDMQNLVQSAILKQRNSLFDQDAVISFLKNKEEAPLPAIQIRWK